MVRLETARTLSQCYLMEIPARAMEGLNAGLLRRGLKNDVTAL